VEHVSTHNSIRTLEPKPAAPQPAPAAKVRPVNPFAMSWRFDRSRGEFVVHAGARAGGLAVAAAALLAVGALGFVGDAIRDASRRSAADAVLAAAEAPLVTATPEAVAAPARRVEHANAKPPAQQSKKAAKKPSKQPAQPKAVATRDGKAARPPVLAVEAAQPAHARQAGLNYLVIQSFPNQPEAVAACNALAARGVRATVERNLPGWAGKSWYSVVGTTGFDMDRQRGQFDRHVKELKAMKLAPKPYRWRGPAEVASGQ
jgi:hypothetical protein